MYTLTKYLFLALLIGLAGVTTTSEFKDVKADDEIVYSQVDPRYHDVKCECGICTEESMYYMELSGNDSTLKIGQTVTVMSIETLSNNGDTLTAVTLK